MSEAFPAPEILTLVRQLVINVEKLADGQQRLTDGQLRLTEGQLRVIEEQQRISARLDRMEARFDGLEARLDRVERRFDGLEARLDRVETRFDGLEARLDRVETRFDELETKIGGLATVAALTQTREELSKLRSDVMDRLDRFQASLDSVRDSMAVTLMMDQRVSKKLDEAGKDRDELFAQMMAMERQMMLLSVRIDAIEERRH